MFVGRLVCWTVLSTRHGMCTSPFGRWCGPPTASPLFGPQCTVGVLAGTHWGALRCPGRMASEAGRQPFVVVQCWCLWTCDVDIVHARILPAESVQVVHVVSRVPLVQQTDASVPRVAQRSASIEFRAGRFHLLHRLSRDAFYFSLGQEFLCIWPQVSSSSRCLCAWS